MAVQPKTAAELESLDPVWAAVRRDAEKILDSDPNLAGFVLASVLNHDSFESALIWRLAKLLDHNDVPGDLVRHAFSDMLAADAGIGAAARADLMATLDRDPACERAIEPLLFYKGYQAIQTHRFAHALRAAGRRDFALYLQSRSSQAFQADINPAVPMGRGIMLDHGTGLVVGETAVIGDQVSILHGVTLGGTGKEDEDRHPKVGSGVLIGAGAKILGNIRIGDNAKVAAGSVVLKDVPAHMTVAGVPAKVVGEVPCARPSQSMDQTLYGVEDHD